jgi:hypothetical protein
MRVEPWQVPVMVMAILAGPVWLYYWAQGHFTPHKSLAEDGVPQGGASGNSLPEGSGGTRHESPPGTRSPARGWARTAALGALTLLLVGIFTVALGPTTVDRVVTGATAVTTLVAAHLTLQSLLSQRTEQLREGSREPATDESADNTRST